ncbi:MAG: ChbG/HpnK family deacetylase [Acetobacteraceae bacterium]|nr:ChbG/HpnK family deacetylase [Acetobacteraceae bacterium]
MGDRWVVPHVDDLGASHGANVAFLELARARRVTCGSVMVPAPWFRELVELCAGAEWDIGVHLTLTSEWSGVRWAPISTASRTSGLIDDDGYFPRDLATLRRQVVPEAAEAEMRAQIERAIAAGLRPTHLDAHMAAAMLPSLLEIQVRLAREYGLFPVLPRSITWAPDPDAYQAVLAELDLAGSPVVDHCRGTQPVPPSALTRRWRTVLEALPPGITHLALHATAPGEFAAISQQHAPWRFAEYRALRRGMLADLCAELGIGVLGTRALQARWRAVAFTGPSTPAPSRSRRRPAER